MDSLSDILNEDKDTPFPHKSSASRSKKDFIEEDYKNDLNTLDDFSPLKWKEFFDRKEILQTDEEDFFNVYFKGSNGPLFFLIHGGGYSALTWACFVVSSIKNINIVLNKKFF